MNRRKFVKLSALAGMATALPGCIMDSLDNELTKEYEAIVIGTGFGGAVSALRLGQAGVKTALIERGRSWLQHDFSPFLPPNKKAAWKSKQFTIPLVNLTMPLEEYTGILEEHHHPNMSIYNAAGVGGGSLAFGGTFVTPAQSIFEYVFPSEVNYDDMVTNYYSKVANLINISHIPDDIYQSVFYKYARAFKQQIENAGMTSTRLPACYDWDVIRQELNGELPKDFLHGDGMFGYSHNGKKSLDKNYIPQAINTGNVDLYSLHEAIRIEDLGNDGYKITLDQLAENGMTIRTKQFTCKYLFLCAGTPNTIKILLRSKHNGDLPAVNSQVGKGFGTNGKTFFRRSIRENSGSYTAFVPAEGVYEVDNPITPVFVEAIPQPISLIIPGFDLKSIFNVGLGVTDYRGSFEYNPDTDQLDLEWSSNGVDKVIDAVKNWCDRVNSNNEGSFTDSLIIQDQFSKNVTYHPLGGCVIGQATDDYGRLEGYRNFYINDSTLIPGLVGGNPAFTVGALAERNIDHIIRNDIA